VINQLFTFSSTIERLRQGPLSEHLDAYAAVVAEQGCAPHSIRQQIVVIADFSRWLKQKRIAVQELDSKVVDRFLRLRLRQQRVRRGDPKALHRLLTLLGQKGVVMSHQPPVADTARSRIINEFQRYLLQERGLSPLTLSERFHNSAPNFANAARSARHRIRDAPRTSVESCAGRADGNGTSVVFSLSPPPRSDRHRSCWLRAHRPQLVAIYASEVLPTDDVERILDGCDRKTSVGRRTHAILLLLARRCQITIRGKGGKSAQLPLAADVGAALAVYLRHDRPRSATRSVFLRHRAPLVGFGNSSTIFSLVRRALKHAGVESAHTGAHVLRHPSHEPASAGRLAG
jgi:hypothetical protein